METQQTPDERTPDPIATLLNECRMERTALWQLLCSSDQWKRIQQLDGAIAALEQVQELQQAKENTTDRDGALATLQAQ